MNVKRERVLTFLVLAGLTAAFLAAVALPGRQTRSRLKAEIAASEAEIARGPEILESFRKERNRLKERTDFLRSSAGTVGGTDDLLQEISRVATDTGLRVVRIEPEAIRVQQTYAESPFHLDFHAKLGPLTAFLRGLESHERYFVIEELSVRNQTGQASPDELEGKIRFVVYTGNDRSATPDEENDSRT